MFSERTSLFFVDTSLFHVLIKSKQLQQCHENYHTVSSSMILSGNSKKKNSCF